MVTPPLATQHGTDITGTGEKESENDRDLLTGAHSHVNITGSISGKKITTTFVEEGTERKTEGTFDWTYDSPGRSRAPLPMRVALPWPAEPFPANKQVHEMLDRWVDGRDAARYNTRRGAPSPSLPPSYERETTRWDESRVPLPTRSERHGPGHVSPNRRHGAYY